MTSDESPNKFLGIFGNPPAAGGAAGGKDRNRSTYVHRISELCKLHMLAPLAVMARTEVGFIWICDVLVNLDWYLV